MNYPPTATRAWSTAYRRAFIVSSVLAIVPTFAVRLGAQTAPTAPASAAPAATSTSASGEVITMEKFVSTGTRFNDRTVADSPVPIDVITASDLNSGGYSETGQVLQTLIPSFNYPRPSLTDGTDHIRPATLRGLAPDQTLVLINGKRQHTSALVNLNGSIGRGSVSTDFNVIPTSAIGQIEVLRDGASAQYGSDAIAGVINVILRKDTGWGTDLSYSQMKKGDGRDFKFDAWTGTHLGTKGSLFVTAFMQNNSPTSRIEADTRQQYFGKSATGAATTISGNYGSGTGLSAASGTLDPRETTVNRINHRYGDPRSKEDGIFFNADYPIADGIDAYAFGGFTRKHGEGAGFFRRAGDDRTIRAIWPNGFLPVIQSQVYDTSLGGGVKGKAADWNWDVSTAFGDNTLRYQTAQSINDTLGASSPTSFYDGKLIFSEDTTNLDLNRSFPIGLKNPLKVALGGEHRWEKYKVVAGAPNSYIDGGVRILDGPNAGTIGGSAPGAQVFPGFKPSDAGGHTRNSDSAYLDMENDITDQWLVSAAGRVEHYSDFGSDVTGKIASRFEFTKGFAARGSISSGFRAPHLAQEWFSSTATNFIGGLPFEIKTFPVSDPVARALGASSLKPEKSTNYSGGFTWNPIPAFTGSVDFYRIDIRDRIVLSSNYTGTAVTNFLVARGLPAVGGGRYFTNAVDTRTSGVDLTARYVLKTNDTGKFTFTAGANVNETKITKYKPTPPQLAALGITTPLFDLTEQTRMAKGQPRDNINVMITYDLKNWSFMLRNVRYGRVSGVAFTNETAAQIAALTPGYDVSFADTVPVSTANPANKQVIQTFEAKWITDLDITWRFSKQFSVSVGANNLFDVYPTQNIRSRVVNGAAFTGSDNVGIFPYSSLSPFGFNGASYYGKVSYKF
jgi:iron complex outermembrane recepter protein